MKLTRKLVIEISVGLAVLAVVAAVLFFVIIRPGIEMHRDAEGLVGKSRRDAIEKMGDPGKTYTAQEWEPGLRTDYANGYNPDPPRIACDEVLIYSELSMVIILYIREDRVVHVHSCGT